MHCYRLFNLHVHSELPMFGLPLTSHEKADVVITFGKLGLPGPDQPAFPPLVSATETEALFYWEHIGGLQVKEGKEVVLDPVPEAETSILQHIAQGVAMGVILHQRGFFTLHASAVAMQGGVVAFVGWKGWGKSTTAAALHGHGYPFVTDDVLAIDLQAEAAFQVMPGVPYFKLWPDALTASLDEDAEPLERITEYAEKRVRSTADAAQQTVLPLKRLYVLDFFTEEEEKTATLPVSQPLNAREACIELIRHSYALRFLAALKENTEHLQQCVRMVQQVPVCRLKRVSDLGKLADVVACIEADLAQDAENAAVAPPIA